MSTLLDRWAIQRDRLRNAEQLHILDLWPQLTTEEQLELLSDLEQIDWELCRPLVESHVRRRPVVALPSRIDPPSTLAATAAEAPAIAPARKSGIDAIRTGRVAAFTVAGGQGTRLGFDGPKGAFPCTPIRHATLFQLFAETLLGVRRRYGAALPWYIMTSPSNHQESVAFFEQHGFFGLQSADVTFFSQGQMPAFLPDGRLALQSRSRLALSPDGHGGSLRALAQSGALVDMQRRGVEHVSYFQVDNPLVHLVDPSFIGLHIKHESEMSSKAVHKAHDTERVGNFCLADGSVSVIEYSDFPEELATARNPDGTRRFDAGSIAIHVIRRDFVEKLTSGSAGARLPWHRADKKIPVYDPEFPAAPPAPTDVVKLETFVFDAIPLARAPLVMYTDRAEEFSPIKNSQGADSPDTARRDMVRRAARWLRACNCDVPCRTDHEPDAVLEISPRFALDADDLREQLNARPRIERGSRFLLE